MAKEGDDFWLGVILTLVGAAIASAAILYARKAKAEKYSPLKEIRELINTYQSNNKIRELAAKIVQNCSASDFICEISTIFNFVTSQIKYMKDPKREDYFSNPLETLKLKIGDCDCKSILLATLLESIGHETQVVLIPGHAFVRVSIKEEDKDKLPQDAYYIEDGDNVWVPLESTAVGAYIGWMNEAAYNAFVTGNVELG